MNKTVTIIVGSFRKGSFNQTLGDYIKIILENKDLSVDFLNYKNLPILEQDTEFSNPIEIKEIRKQIEKSDGLIIISPEYNGSYPALLKNLLDWLSRPVIKNDYSTPTVINGKCVSVASVAGSTAGKNVRSNLLNLTNKIKMKNMAGEGLGISLTSKDWETGKLEISKEQKNIINNFVNDFLNFIK